MVRFFKDKCAVYGDCRGCLLICSKSTSISHEYLNSLTQNTSHIFHDMMIHATCSDQTQATSSSSHKKKFKATLVELNYTYSQLHQQNNSLERILSTSRRRPTPLRIELGRRRKRDAAHIKSATRQLRLWAPLMGQSWYVSLHGRRAFAIDRLRGARQRGLQRCSAIVSSESRVPRC